MTIKEIGEITDFEIRKQFKNRKNFAEKTNRSYVSLNKTISKMIEEGKDLKFKNLESVLNDLGYELVIRKKDSE